MRTSLRKATLGLARLLPTISARRALASDRTFVSVPLKPPDSTRLLSRTMLLRHLLPRVDLYPCGSSLPPRCECPRTPALFPGPWQCGYFCDLAVVMCGLLLAVVLARRAPAQEVLADPAVCGHVQSTSVAFALRGCDLLGLLRGVPSLVWVLLVVWCLRWRCLRGGRLCAPWSLAWCGLWPPPWSRVVRRLDPSAADALLGSRVPSAGRLRSYRLGLAGNGPVKA